MARRVKNDRSENTERGQLRVVGYVRVSTEEQAESGGGIGAQRDAITAACQARGYELVEIIEDAGFSAKSMARPGITNARQRLDAGEADALVVSKLDRLSRSLIDFAHLMEHARRQGWAIIALDLGVDTTTPAGELVANVMASVAQWERRAIGQRTKDALASKRAAGVVLGRPLSLSEDTATRILGERAAGRSLTAIAEGLNRDQIPTAQGGVRWYPSSVRAVVIARASPS